MRDAGAGGRAEVLENQHILDTSIGIIQGAYTIPVHADEAKQVILGHFMNGDTVFGVVDDDFVTAIAVDRLL